MKKHLLPATVLAVVLALVLFAPTIAFSQNPTSGALLTITGTAGSVPVNLKIYDSQIHSGVVQTVPVGGGSLCSTGDQIPTDAYVLQGGSATGCDPGDVFEVTDNNGSESAHQAAGKADLPGFHIETHYLCGGSCTGSTGSQVCNTSGTICAAPDTGFLTVTNTGSSTFAGTISLTGRSPIAGGGDCPANGVASDSWTTGLNMGQSVTLALGTPGTDGANTSDSSNCGGFNQPQTAQLTAGITSTFLFGNDAYLVTPVNSNPGDVLSFLPIPVPAGPLGSPSFPAFAPGQFASETPVSSSLRFSASNFTNQACIPFADFSAPGNPVCPEVQLNCTNGEGTCSDASTFLYASEADYSIDTNSITSSLIGGPHFLGVHDPVQCFTSGFTFDTITSFTSVIVAPDPPLTKGGGRGNSCFAVTWTPGVPVIPANTTISTFSGFEAFVSDTKINPIYSRSFFPEILVWDSSTSSGNPVTNLRLCPAVNPDGTCATLGVSPPWVNLSLIQAPNSICPAGFPPAGPLPSFFNTGLLPGDEAGEYVFLWNTNTKVKNLKGCQVKVVLQFDTGMFVAPATFQYVF
jgi:hypothetical protein